MKTKQIATMSQLVEMSQFFQAWSGKKMTIKNWFGNTGVKRHDNLSVQNTNSKLQAYKEQAKDSHLTINEIAQLAQHEPRTAMALLEKGVQIQYQRFTIDIKGYKGIKGINIDTIATNNITGNVHPVKITQAQALKQITNQAQDNDLADILTRLYQLFK